MIGRLSAAFVAAALLAGAAAGSAQAAVCKSGKTTALGNWSVTMTGARISARYAWKRKVRAKYGSRYSTWWRSADKSYGCWSYEGRERCRVKARPCRAGD